MMVLTPIVAALSGMSTNYPELVLWIVGGVIAVLLIGYVLRWFIRDIERTRAKESKVMIDKRQ